MRTLKLFVFSNCLLVTLLVSAQVAEPTYTSVFNDYQTHKDVPLRDWNVSNEAVRAAGGWREYLKEAQAPDPATKAQVIAPKTSSEAAHPRHSEAKKP